MKFPLGEMSAGDILDRGIKLLFARLPTFYFINLVVLAPVILVQIAAPLVFQNEGNPVDPNAIFATLGFLGFAIMLTLLLYPLGAAAILHIVMEEYIGNKASIGQAASFALTRFFPLVGASILVGLLIFVGTLLCCIPGIYFAITYVFASQVVVLERLGAGQALERSSKLISGHRWRVFGVLFLIYFANWIVQTTIAVALGVALPAQEIVPAANGPRVQVNVLNHVVTTLVAQLVSIVFTTDRKSVV